MRPGNQVQTSVKQPAAAAWFLINWRETREGVGLRSKARLRESTLLIGNFYWIKPKFRLDLFLFPAKLQYFMPVSGADVDVGFMADVSERDRGIQA
jgi:hypothetical protein